MSNNIINRVKARQASFNMPVNQEVTRYADGSGGPISINKQTSNQDEYKQENKGERSWYDNFSDWGHTALDMAGVIPGIGAVADLANAGWYGAEGAAKGLGIIDDVGAGEGWAGNMAFAGAAAIPGIGQGVTAAKYALKAGRAGKNMKLLENVKKGWQGMSNTGRFFNVAIPGATMFDNVPQHIENTKEYLNRPTTDNKYENNQRESSRVSQGGENYKSTHEKNYDPNKKAWVKKGGKATGKIADYAVGSDARKKEYDARGWKYDDSIRGDHKGAYTGTKENKPIITPATGVEEKKKNLPYNTYGFGVLPGPK